MTEIHNLDEGVREYFEFSIKGHVYQFRHLTTDEMTEMKKLEADALEKFLYQFITKKDDAAPEFTEVAKHMITPEWVNFKKMVVAEFGG